MQLRVQHVACLKYVEQRLGFRVWGSSVVMLAQYHLSLCGSSGEREVAEERPLRRRRPAVVAAAPDLRQQLERAQQDLADSQRELASARDDLADTQRELVEARRQGAFTRASTDTAVANAKAWT